MQAGDGTMHYWIIGAGVVSVPGPQGEAAAMVTKIQALGLSVTEQPGLNFGLGYVEGMYVAVPDGVSDVRIEVSQDLLGPLRIDTIKTKTNQGEEDEH